MNFRHKKRAPIDISLTPMIDVVFLLLIFFMVTTTFTKQTVVKINLPEADGEAANQQLESLRFSINNKGDYFINDKALAVSDSKGLREALTAYNANKSMPFIISADAKAPVQSAISVLDIAGQLEFNNITFATEQP